MKLGPVIYRDTLFIRLRYREPFQVIEILENRKIKKIYRDKKICHCESSQKFHGNEIRTVLSAFGSDKQKRTTSEVHTHYANEFAVTLVEGYMYIPVVIGSQASMRE